MPRGIRYSGSACSTISISERVLLLHVLYFLFFIFDHLLLTNYDLDYGNFFDGENPCFLFGRKLIFPFHNIVYRLISVPQYDFFRWRLTFFRHLSIFWSEAPPTHYPAEKYPPQMPPIWVLVRH